MMQGIYVAASGSVIQQQRLEMAANNLANVNTIGYKGDRAAFKAYLPPWGGEKSIPAYGPSPLPLKYTSLIFKDNLVYTMMDEIKTDFSPGTERFTGNPLDLTIKGRGFFVLRSPEGHKYTRAGDFSINSEGRLVDGNGLPVMGKKGEIIIKGKEVAFAEDGGIFVDGVMVDTLRLVDFEDLRYLKKEGENLFLNTDKKANPEKSAKCTIKQGALEIANVNIIKEMVGMIDLLRAYEAYQRCITSQDTINGRCIAEVGRGIGG